MIALDKQIFGDAVKVTVIGSGYAGFVTGTCLAVQGNNVFCDNVDSKKRYSEFWRRTYLRVRLKGDD
jgi:hypothetical protein